MSLEAQYADMTKMLQPPLTLDKDEHFMSAFSLVMDAFHPPRRLELYTMSVLNTIRGHFPPVLNARSLLINESENM